MVQLPQSLATSKAEAPQSVTNVDSLYILSSTSISFGILVILLLEGEAVEAVPTPPKLLGTAPEKAL